MSIFILKFDQPQSFEKKWYEFWEKNKLLVPSKITDGKTRYYSKELLISVFGEALNWENLEKGDVK